MHVEMSGGTSFEALSTMAHFSHKNESFISNGFLSNELFWNQWQVSTILLSIFFSFVGEVCFVKHLML